MPISARALLIRVGFATVWTAAVAHADEPKWSLERLMTAMAGAREAQAAFVEERHLQYLTEPLIVEGVLRYAPGRLEKHILRPEEERLIVRGNRVTIVAPGTERRSVLLSDYPALEATIVGLRATLDGDLDTLKRHYWIDYDADGRNWRLGLTPLEEDVRRRILGVRLAGIGGWIASLEVVEQAGDRYVIRIRKN